MKSLTKKQREVFEFLKAYVTKHGYPPTYREIASHFGFLWSASKGHLKALEKKGFIRLKPSKSRGIEIMDFRISESQFIPVVGRIKAGEPGLALEEIEFYISVDRKLFNFDAIFCLRVQGDSMIRAGIFDGDFVIVKPQPTLEHGEIGVFLVDQEATIKRVLFGKNKIALKPENPEMKTKNYDPSEIIVIGKVVGLFRKF